MYSNRASAIKQGEPIYHTGFADAAALTEGSPVALDLAAIAGATCFDGKVITDYQAVSSFLAKPSAANGLAFMGIAERAFARGDFKRIVAGGPCRARVHNTLAVSLSLAVGDTLVPVAGQDYLVPLYQAISAGDSVAVSNHAACPRAMVRKAATILAGATALVEVWVFPIAAPKTRTLNFTLAGVNVTNLVIPLGVTRGPGRIIRAGFGFEVCGTGGSAALDVLIGTTSIFSVVPAIGNDGVDGSHTLVDITAAALGTGGVYGTVNPAANIFVANQKISATVTYTNGAAQAGLNVQVELLEQ